MVASPGPAGSPRAPRTPAGRQPASAPGIPAPAPAVPALKQSTGPLKVGDVLAERYLLLDNLSDTAGTTVWRARDEVLARTVTVKCIPTSNKAAREAAQPFLDAGARLGGINHPGVARVYDAALEPRPGRGNDIAYVISEWVEGEPLDVHLDRVGALAAPDATDIVRQAADALTATHAAGLLHGRVHPGNVIVTPTGRVRLTDAAVAATLHAQVRDTTVDTGMTAGGVADDTRDLSAVLYALLTRQWPAAATPQPGGTLGPAPVENGHVLSTRQLRAAVPRTLDNVVTRGLEPNRVPALGPLRTPAALAGAADESTASVRAEQLEQETKEAKPPGLVRRSIPWVFAAAFIAAVGVVGWTLGLAVGELPGRSNTVDAIVSSPEPAKPGTVTYPPIPVTAAMVKDFDPLGKDHQENPDQVPNAVDGDPSTAWSTSVYRSPGFSGLKPGVGLLIDLTKSRALHGVAVGFTASGASVEVRVSDTAPATADDMKLVARDAKGDQLARMKPLAGTTGRYVLIWITDLPKNGNGYQVGVSELRLT